VFTKAPSPAAVPPHSLLITFGSLSERETAIFVAKDYGLFARRVLAAASGCDRAPPERAAEISSEGAHAQGAPARMSWARLLSVAPRNLSRLS